MLFALATVVASLGAESSAAEFRDWMRQHHRSYSSVDQQQQRFKYFERNTMIISKLQKETPLAKYNLDDRSDWSPAEMSSLLPAQLYGQHAQRQPAFEDVAVHAAFKAGPIDWVEKGAVTPAISQGRCGTCAQFSATADIEAQWHLAGHPLVPLAVQEMIDCSSYTGPYGMGWVSDIKKGIATAADYPLANHSDPTLAGCRSPCNMTEANRSFAHIDGATCLPQPIHDNETQMLTWLQHGPLSVSVAAGPFNGYKGGIITGATCNTTAVDHAVLLVGYGKEGGTPYWKLKNSWGPTFGEQGYVRIQAFDACLGIRGACQAFIGSPPPANSTVRRR